MSKLKNKIAIFTCATSSLLIFGIAIYIFKDLREASANIDASASINHSQQNNNSKSIHGEPEKNVKVDKNKAKYKIKKISDNIVERLNKVLNFDDNLKQLMQQKILTFERNFDIPDTERDMFFRSIKSQINIELRKIRMKKSTVAPKKIWEKADFIAKFGKIYAIFKFKNYETVEDRLSVDFYYDLNWFDTIIDEYFETNSTYKTLTRFQEEQYETFILTGCDLTNIEIIPIIYRKNVEQKYRSAVSAIFNHTGLIGILKALGLDR